VTVLDVPQGQARIQARPFNNPNTRLELHTPSGIAAVRGTDFGVAVAADGKTSIGTLEGRVESTAQSSTVEIDGGLASVIRPGEPPTPPRPLDQALEIEQKTTERRGSVLLISGRINPTNTLLLDDTEISVSRTGYFEVVLPSANLSRSVSLVVRNPLGESRIHRILLWQVPDADQPL
jgi:hypothetical protein